MALEEKEGELQEAQEHLLKSKQNAQSLLLDKEKELERLKSHRREIESKFAGLRKNIDRISPSTTFSEGS